MPWKLQQFLEISQCHNLLRQELAFHSAMSFQSVMMSHGLPGNFAFHSLSDGMNCQAPDNLGRSLVHLAIGHHNCTPATCCFMPFRNPFLPSADRRSERASRPFDSDSSVFSPYDTATRAHIHSFDRHEDRRLKIRAILSLYSVIALLSD